MFDKYNVLPYNRTSVMLNKKKIINDYIFKLLTVTILIFPND